MNDHKKFMREALKEARKAFDKGEVPVGAVAVHEGHIIARAHNKRELMVDPTAHAEILCIQKAAKKLGGWRLGNVTLYSTLEPCPMCTGAIIHARLKELVFGSPDPKAGGCGGRVDLLEEGLFNHTLTLIKGVLAKESSDIMKSFFLKLRNGKTYSRRSKKFVEYLLPRK